MFLVWRGQMTIEFRDNRVTLKAGELCVVPRGVEHRTMADAEAEVLVFEPAETRNTAKSVAFDDGRRKVPLSWMSSTPDSYRLGTWKSCESFGKLRLLTSAGTVFRTLSLALGPFSLEISIAKSTRSGFNTQKPNDG